MDPDSLADVGVHGAAAGVVGHRISLINHSVCVRNNVDERKGKLLAADAWGPERDAAHVGSGKLDCCPVCANGADPTSNGIPAAGDPPGNEPLQTLSYSFALHSGYSGYSYSCQMLLGF